MASQPIYTFYCKLLNVKPTVWRVIEVPENRSVAQLGYILMTLFEMRASHLFQVLTYDQPRRWTRMARPIKSYKIPDPENDIFDTPIIDATSAKLKDTFYLGHPETVFEYDFGDGWEVSIVLTDIDIDPELDGHQLPRVQAGAGFGIVEDIGGADGLMQLHQNFQNGTVDADTKNWLGFDHFDLSDFDLAEMNQRVKKIPRIYKQIFEDRLYPTEASIKLITRGRG